MQALEYLGARGPTFYAEVDLLELTIRLRRWLAGDTQKTYEKFNGGQESEKLLLKACLLHPRSNSESIPRFWF